MSKDKEMNDGKTSLFPLGVIKNNPLPAMAPSAKQAVGKTKLPKQASAPKATKKLDGRNYAGK